MNLQIKVLSDKHLIWQTVCKVPDKIYNDFNQAVRLEDLDMNTYLSVWAKRDWSVYINMGQVDGIDRLRYYINLSNQKAYPELYVLKSYGIEPSEDFWVNLWIASHMLEETERRK